MIDTDKYVEFLAKHAPSTKKRIYVAETSSGRVQHELWDIAMSSLIEVERLRDELDTIKSDRSFQHRFSPTAYGMANEAWRGLTESENSVNETFDDLRLLTKEEWWQWQEEDMDWPWDCDEIVDALDDAHYTYLRKCIDMLEKEGGIMALKKRLQESGEE